MHDVRAQEVGKFLDGALDEHSNAGVKVGNIGFEGIDVLEDDFNLFHGKVLCEVGQAHRCAQEAEPDMSSVGVVVVAVAFLETE